MKKLLLIIVFVFSGILVHAITTDSTGFKNTDEIVEAVLGKRVYRIEQYLASIDNWYTNGIVEKNNIFVFIEVNGAVLMFRFYTRLHETTGGGYMTINRVIVKFYHNNKNQLIERNAVRDRHKYSKFRQGQESTDVIYDIEK